MLRKLAAAIAQPWIPLALGLMIVIGVGVVTTRTVTASEGLDTDVRQSLSTISAADGVMLALSEMNAAQRGFILNRNAAFRARYAKAVQELETDHALLRELALPNGVEQATMTMFENSLAERLESFGDVEEFIGNNDLVAAGEYSSSTRLYTDDVRAALGAIKQAAFAKLQERQKRAADAANLALALTIAGLLIASLLILVSIVLLLRKTSQLQRANNAVLAMAKSLERRVEARTAELAAANDEIQRFAYIVSHDLRSPLVNVMGFTAELEEAQQTVAEYLAAMDAGPVTAVPDEVRSAVITDMPEAMGFIRASTARMDRLIKAILHISREGRRPLLSHKIALDDLFAGLGDSLSGQLAAADATLDIGPLPIVEGDELALEQIFGNLLDNAVKYLRPGVPGRIAVTSDTTGNRVAIRVTDNGRGVAEADRQRIFELFRRAGEQDQPGEGIGLAHVQALIRRLGGNITVESEHGKGSCFTVNLPLTMTAGSR